MSRFQWFLDGVEHRTEFRQPITIHGCYTLHIFLKNKTIDGNFMSTAGLYPSTNWPPVNGGQNSILDWVFKLNLSPNEKKKNNKKSFSRALVFGIPRNRVIWAGFFFQNKRTCLCYKATSIVYILCLVPTRLRWHARLDTSNIGRVECNWNNR
jgi:hypothetical protein